MASASSATSIARPSSNFTKSVSTGSHQAPDSAKVGSVNPIGLVMVWCLIWLIQVSLCWSTGYRDLRLRQAVEKGVVQIESRERLNHDPSVITSKRESQRSTAAFWRILWQISDFGLEPFALWFRLWAIPLAVSASALIGGRLIHTDEIRPSVALWMILALPRPIMELLSAVSNSNSSDKIGLNLILPSGQFPAVLFQSLAQLDLFWIASMIFTVLSISRYNQLKLRHVGLACIAITLLEWSVRVVFGLIVGAGIHETLIPAEPFQVGKGPGP